MTQLVALLSTGTNTWGEVASLLVRSEFDELFILTNSFGKQTFTNLPKDKKVEVFVFDLEKPMGALRDDFVSALKPHMGFNDVGVNMASGTGKEHMALFSALMQLGVGFRLVGYADNEVTEL